MQMRLADVVVNDFLNFVHENPTDATHSIIVNKTADDDELVILLSLQGVTSYFTTRRPTNQELASFQSFDLMSDAPDWNPTSPMFQEQEASIVDNFGRVKETGNRYRGRFISSTRVSHTLNQTAAYDSQCDDVLSNMTPMLHDIHFFRQLKANVHVSATTTPRQRST